MHSQSGSDHIAMAAVPDPQPRSTDLQDPLCVPIEAMLTTAKVKGTAEMSGCCCCLDLRGGVLVMSAVFAVFSFLGEVVAQVYAIVDKGLGVPEGYPPEFPPMRIVAAEEIVSIWLGFACTISCAFAFLRALKRELKDMRIIFRVNAAVVIILALMILVINPFIFFPQACIELEEEHLSACSGWANASTCLAQENPIMGYAGTPRCSWDGAGSCGICATCGHVACEITGVSFSMIMAVVDLGWRVYFLFVLNAYIVRYEQNEGQSIVADSTKVAAGMFSSTANPAEGAEGDGAED